MARSAVKTLLYLLDRVFETDEEHSVIGNLTKVGPAEWDTVPEGCERSIAQIVHHVATCYHAYFENAFTDAGQSFARTGERAPATREDLMAWLLNGHEVFRAAVTELEDADLDSDRGTHWGGAMPARALIATVIEHDAYHAGEINHLRALLQRDDSWFGSPAR
jgi:uncharacterized damage-inducible protein DinB